ncbi:unnamed protein product [Linum trigynum]|uniref:Chitin-binding type-1 domain-containing protein n=1 Tax=Linum trigynum TaxID=586398 RepID=A0AAV2E8S6_9ROSI
MHQPTASALSLLMVTILLATSYAARANARKFGESATSFTFRGSPFSFNDTARIEHAVDDEGSCGGESGSCEDNLCCSKYGYCGDDDRYCGRGCQPQFGNCGGGSGGDDSPPPPTKKKHPAPPPDDS